MGIVIEQKIVREFIRFGAQSFTETADCLDDFETK